MKIRVIAADGSFEEIYDNVDNVDVKETMKIVNMTNRKGEKIQKVFRNVFIEELEELEELDFIYQLTMSTGEVIWITKKDTRRIQQIINGGKDFLIKMEGEYNEIYINTKFVAFIDKGERNE